MIHVGSCNVDEPLHIAEGICKIVEQVQAKLPNANIIVLVSPVIIPTYEYGEYTRYQQIRIFVHRIQIKSARILHEFFKKS